MTSSSWAGEAPPLTRTPTPTLPPTPTPTLTLTLTLTMFRGQVIDERRLPHLVTVRIRDGG